MTDKSYPPPCRNYLQPLYLSVTLYACAQRGHLIAFIIVDISIEEGKIKFNYQSNKRICLLTKARVFQ